MLIIAQRWCGDTIRKEELIVLLEHIHNESRKMISSMYKKTIESNTKLTKKCVLTLHMQFLSPFVTTCDCATVFFNDFHL